MSKELRVFTFAIATLAVIALIWLTHETMKLSSWIVYSDHVWGEMDRVGAEHEHYFAEDMHLLRGLNFIYFEAVAAQFLFCKSGDQVWGGSAGFMLR
jgi:hypothetical protein